MRKSLLFVLVLLLSFGFMAFADVGTEGVEGEADYIIEDVQGIPGGTYYVGALGGPKTFNPCEAQETSSTDIIDRMFATLVDYGKDSEFRGGDIAKSWEVTEDNTGWYFHIRKGLKWSDGQPLTAEDVVWSFNEVYKVEGLITGNTIDVIRDGDGNLPEVKLIDEDTVLIKYPQPFAPGLRTLGAVTILPKHVMQEAVENKTISEIWTVSDVDDLVASGPYIVTEHIPEVRVVMEKNPYYHRFDTAGNRLPYFDKLVWVICQDQNTMRLKFEAGETDFLAVPADDYPAIKGQEQEKGWVVGPYGPTTSTLFLALNFNTTNQTMNEWFRNVHFRRALSYAMDRDAMIDVIYNGLAQPQWGPISPASPFYDPLVEDYSYPFSLEDARASLEKGGFSWNDDGKLVDKYGNIVKFDLTTNAGNQVREKACNLIVDTFGQLGIEAVFNPIEFNTLVQKLMNTGDWETMIMGLTGGVDPHSGSNVSKIDGGLHFWNYSPAVADFVDPEFYEITYSEFRIDEIFKAQTKEMDPDKRFALFSEYQVLSAQNLPLIYTVQQLRLYAYPQNLKNIQIGGFSSWVWNLWGLYKD
ncbi:MAG TPA: ABC transporter substrate-binding protein [Thermotogota bacterium]|nr:ABC transporter substrate-binding protein [Thermotogota bacterium]HRW92677.1 ABC transporter substrate-binding protein [Thermotogota bacterium]